jgi:xylan 1,4-beta-xylosidase
MRKEFICKRWIARLAVFASLLVPSAASGQNNPVRIEVHVERAEGTLNRAWTYFGYDEPNYTYAANGQNLLTELGALDPSPVYIRVHNLFTSGDGSASLKWGSTNVYTEDASGHPVYTWDIVDRIFDTFRDAGVKPLVELGFMPEALSTHPQPYRHSFPHPSTTSIFTGWAYPPRDYGKWSELVYEVVQHLRQRYGDSEVKTWLWEVWNEPDIAYWQGTQDEYFRLYDVSVASVLRALPDAIIGGPDTTGPGNAKAAGFLRAFLNHCAHGQNYATGKTGSHLDFISFHPKGSAKWENDHVRMGISHQLQAVEEGFEIVASFPEWKQTPIILGESDPEGCAACSVRDNPANAYRNGPLYGAYTIEALDKILALAQSEHVNFKGAVTWAFEFENEPAFAGFRDLATNGVDKPVLNAFRMLGMLGTERLNITSSAALGTESVVREGVRNSAEINAIAARKAREVEILVWNYHDDDVSSDPANVDLEISGLPAEVRRAFMEHFRVDSDHSNAFTAWRGIGSPETLSPTQYERLQAAGQLQLLTSPKWISVEHDSFEMQFSLPREGFSLVRLSW